MGYFNTIGPWERWAGSVNSPPLRIRQNFNSVVSSRVPGNFPCAYIYVFSPMLPSYLFIYFPVVGCTHDGDICVVVVRTQFGEVRTFTIQILGIKFISSGLGKCPYPGIHPSGFVNVFVIVICYSYCNIFGDWLQDK